MRKRVEQRYDLWERVYWFGDDEDEAMIVSDERIVARNVTYPESRMRIANVRGGEDCVDPRFSISDLWLVPV